MARPAARQGKRASMSSVYLRRAHAGIGLLGQPRGASSTGTMEPRLSWLGSGLASTALPASRRRAESTLAGVDDAPAPIEGEEGVAAAQMCGDGWSMPARIAPSGGDGCDRKIPGTDSD